MDYERYYIDLLEVLNSCCRNIASGKYDQNDVDRLFDLARPKRYPSLFAELAESFGMMLVKIERSEVQINQRTSGLAHNGESIQRIESEQVAPWNNRTQPTPSRT